MGRIVDITMAMPGERFRFRMIGTPKSWFRYYVDDGTHLDSDTDIDGIPSTRIFATFASDLDDKSLCVVIMRHELARVLSSKFKMMKVYPGAEVGVDVDITIVYGAIDHIIDVGCVSENITSDLIESMEGIWESVRDDVISYADDDTIRKSPVVPWKPRKWFDGVEDVEAMMDNASSGNYRDALVSFLLMASEMRDEETSVLASRMLRSIRAFEDE